MDFFTAAPKRAVARQKGNQACQKQLVFIPTILTRFRLLATRKTRRSHHCADPRYNADDLARNIGEVSWNCRTKKSGALPSLPSWN